MRRDAHDVGGAPPGAHERVEGGVVEGGELAVGVDQRGLGRGVVGDRGEHPRGVGEDRSHRGGQDRRGHGAAVRAREPRRADQLGEAVGGEERDPGDAVAGVGDATEGASGQQARRDAHVLVGTTTVTGASAPPPLAATTTSNNARRCAAVGHGHERRRHHPDRTAGVRHPSPTPEAAGRVGSVSCGRAPR
jgi:hypothetical protein